MGPVLRLVARSHLRLACSCRRRYGGPFFLTALRRKYVPLPIRRFSPSLNSFPGGYFPCLTVGDVLSRLLYPPWRFPRRGRFPASRKVSSTVFNLFLVPRMGEPVLPVRKNPLIVRLTNPSKKAFPRVRWKFCPCLSIFPPLASGPTRS